LKGEKPFYLRPPWEILFAESKLKRVSPWKIDLAFLLTTLLEEMYRVGIDFRAAGIAINTSALIYLKKAELLLKMEEPPKPPRKEDDVYLPPPLELPFRFEYTTTSIMDLLEALERALEEGQRRPKPQLLTPTLEPSKLELYLIEIEERCEEFLEWLRSLGVNLLTFSSLLDRRWGDAVRVFLMLLLLAQRGELDLRQDEEEGEILILLGGRRNGE
jgi:chromatin segregation and condensation protein Rec8/ScpA/Scc1 (kleisin family)